jgi:hypothetical protein
MGNITTTNNFSDFYVKIHTQKLEEYIEKENLSEKCDKAITLLKDKISSKRVFTFNPPLPHKRGIAAVADFFIEGPIYLIPNDPTIRSLNSYLEPIFPNADSIYVSTYPKPDGVNTGLLIEVSYLPDVKKGVRGGFTFQEIMENSLLLAQIEQKIRKDFTDIYILSEFEDFLKRFDSKIKGELEKELACLMPQMLSIAKDVEKHILNAVDLDFEAYYCPQKKTVLEIKCPLPPLKEEFLKENRLLNVIQDTLESSLFYHISLKLGYTQKKEYFVFVKIHM